jgi:hypothetical protein
MLRAGLIKQEAAGIYAWLPLGLRVLNRIEQIVREEQERAGAVEIPEVRHIHDAINAGHGRGGGVEGRPGGRALGPRGSGRAEREDQQQCGGETRGERCGARHDRDGSIERDASLHD